MIKFLTSNNTLHDISLALKKAYSISLLPPKVDSFYNKIIIRVLRVIGGICIVLVLTGKHSVLVKELQIVVLIFAFIHSTGIIIISIIKLVYGLYIIIKKPEIFEVRNSPLNHFASHLARIVVCAKYGCQGIAVGTGVLAGAVTYDTILEASGRDKIFVSLIAKVFNQAFGEPMSAQHHTNLKDALVIIPLSKYTSG